MPTGLFCCEIPGADDVTQKVCITVEFETDQRDYVTTMTTMITSGIYVYNIINMTLYMILYYSHWLCGILCLH